MNGIFAIEKPTGITSSQFLQKLQSTLSRSQVFSQAIQTATAQRAQEYEKQTGKKPSKRKLRKVMKIKMGHGGTLDPLASGVLVIGIGTGTKRLGGYLNGCIKEYESEALFGVGTTSGDVEGEILSQCSTKHLIFDELKNVESKFLGKLKQTPPIYAALKMNGKPLHEYAREGIPLPKKIEPRQVEIHELEIFKDSLSKEHVYPILRPKDEENEEDIKRLESMNANLLEDKLFYSSEYCEKNGLTSEEIEYKPIKITEEEKEEINKKGDEYRAPMLHLRAKVSSGTYIRSLISDIGRSQGSCAYMVKLIRTSQSEWDINKGNVFTMEEFSEKDESVWKPVLERILNGETDLNVHEMIREEESKTVVTTQPETDAAKPETTDATVTSTTDLSTTTTEKKRTATDAELELEQHD